MVPGAESKEENQVEHQAFISMFAEMGNQKRLIAMIQHLNVTHQDEF